jgi:hypothetical protein
LQLQVVSLMKMLAPPKAFAHTCVRAEVSPR